MLQGYIYIYIKLKLYNVLVLSLYSILYNSYIPFIGELAPALAVRRPVSMRLWSNVGSKSKTSWMKFVIKKRRCFVTKDGEKTC